ncbi:hypothetical protein SpCBS45565_g07387 [Spizellomyces sp. 'palustris']|nr:hypothetical protein SpCBS45565_g07387 [Spizellomyces sp. 'palustris']
MPSPTHSPKRSNGDRRSFRDEVSRSPPRRRRRSPSEDRAPRRNRSRSRSPDDGRGRRDDGNRRDRRNEGRFEGIPESQRYGKQEQAEDKEAVPTMPKEQPNFEVSGALAAEQNMFKGVVLKYSEPPEARKPKGRYRLYVFKGKDQIDMLHVHRQSAFLIGRDRLVTDIPIDHPSCSKQHAVLQYRQIVETDAIGQGTRTVKPYIIDLDATNGTYINGDRIPASRYVELKLGDTLKFGFSTREYVLMSEDLVDEKGA